MLGHAAYLVCSQTDRQRIANEHVQKPYDLRGHAEVTHNLQLRNIGEIDTR
jgi:hypothetical protein